MNTPFDCSSRAIEERRAAAEDRVAVADDEAVGDVDGTIHLQRVTRTDDGDVAQDVPVAHQQQSLGLTARRGLDRQVDEMNVRGVVAHERRAARRERARPLVGADVRRMRIEDLVVGIEDDDLVAVFANDASCSSCCGSRRSLRSCRCE